MKFRVPLKRIIYIYILKKQIFFPFKNSFGQQFFLKKTDFFFQLKGFWKKFSYYFLKQLFLLWKKKFFNGKNRFWKQTFFTWKRVLKNRFLYRKQIFKKKKHFFFQKTVWKKLFLSFTENIFYLIQKPVFIIFQENSFEKQIWKTFFF